MIPVHVVGLGMSPADLTPGALEVINQAQVLVGGRRLLDYFPEHPAREIPLGKDLESALRQVPELAGDQRVVVLASGDPNFYGVAPLVVKLLGADNVVIHPNVTAVQAACARLKISWQDAVVASLHGRGFQALAGGLGRAAKLIIYTDPEHTPAAIARFLLDRGHSWARLTVLEDLGQPTERVSRLTPEEAQGRDFSPLNLVVVELDHGAGSREPGPGAPALRLGLPEDALVHEAGLITKSEVRAIVLASLELYPGLILWDVGAGCGSVGLEASLLVPGGRIFAVERDPDRAAQIRANREKFGVENLEVILDEAPPCLADLPNPQRVFVGGGGRRLGDILRAVLGRLGPGGKVVLTAALLESLETARKIFRDAGWPVEVVHLQVSRSRPLSTDISLFALNPVWIVTGSHPKVQDTL
jgi:precorrin-6Y C5,15-methyltransferase (decarboxylating)